MKPLKFAAFGAGYWSRFQLAGWREIGGTQCVAIYNRTLAKAQSLAQEFSIPTVYDNPEQLLENQTLDFVDIITDVDSHPRFVQMAAERGIPVICQKPMAPDLASAKALVETCRSAGVPFAVNENWRWQTPIRAVKTALASGVTGAPFRASLRFCNSYPVFVNQPFLGEIEEFILADMGSHILDVARFLFGEAKTVYCTTRRIHKDIKGEDVATVMMTMGENVTVTVELSYASPQEHDRFPETFIHIECEQGSIELAPDYWVRVTTAGGTHARRHQPPFYPWVDPNNHLTTASIADAQRSLRDSLRQGIPAETSGEDNLKTLQLVYGAYASAHTGQVIDPNQL